MNFDMKAILFCVVVVVLGCPLDADSVSFVQAYESGNYDEAAKQSASADVANAGIARRLGVMYYTAKGVSGDQMKGKGLLEQAMIAGDAIAAVNLAKIYFKIERNAPKAAWCILVAETINDASVKDDVKTLHGYLGDEYLKGLASYISQLRDQLANEQEVMKIKTSKFEQDRVTLAGQITSNQDELIRKDEAFALEREKLISEKNELAKKISDLEEILSADKMKIDELNAIHTETLNENQSLASRLKNSEGDVAAAQNDIAGFKNLIKQMEASTLGSEVATEKISSKDIYKRYNQLIEKYNELVRKYNKLLSASCETRKNGN